MRKYTIILSHVTSKCNTVCYRKSRIWYKCIYTKWIEKNDVNSVLIIIYV